MRRTPGGPPKPAPPASQHGKPRTAPMRPGPKSPRKCGPAQAGRPPETKRSVYHGAQHPDGLRRILSFQPYDQCTLLEIRTRVDRISSIATRRAAKATRPSPLPALRTRPDAVLKQGPAESVRQHVRTGLTPEFPKKRTSEECRK